MQAPNPNTKVITLEGVEFYHLNAVCELALQHLIELALTGRSQPQHIYLTQTLLNVKGSIEAAEDTEAGSKRFKNEPIDNWLNTPEEAEELAADEEEAPEGNNLLNDLFNSPSPWEEIDPSKKFWLQFPKDAHNLRTEQLDRLAKKLNLSPQPKVNIKEILQMGQIKETHDYFQAALHFKDLGEKAEELKDFARCLWRDYTQYPANRWTREKIEKLRDSLNSLDMETPGTNGTILVVIMRLNRWLRENNT